MAPPKFDNIINKAKSVTQKVADQTNKLAKVAKLKTNVMTLNGEKSRHINTIGLRTYTMFTENNSIDGTALYEKVRDEIAQIERVETRVREIEAEIAELQANAPHVDVQDVTDEEGESK